MKVWITKIREIEVEGFKVELHNFGYASFLYPKFNGNAEFDVTRQGYKKLRHYLRMVKWSRSNLAILN